MAKKVKTDTDTGKPAIALITTAVALNKEKSLLLTEIGRTSTRINNYLLSEIAHIERHRNPTRLNAFFTELGKSRRAATIADRKAMIAYVNTYANCTWNGEKFEMNKARADASEMFMKACGDHWTRAKAEPTPAPAFDKAAFEASLARLIQKAIKKGVAADMVRAVSNASGIAGYDTSKKKVVPVDNKPVATLIKAPAKKAPAKKATAKKAPAKKAVAA